MRAGIRVVGPKASSMGNTAPTTLPTARGDRRLRGWVPLIPECTRATPPAWHKTAKALKTSQI